MKTHIIGALAIFAGMTVAAQNREQITFDYNDQRQEIHSFGASDCWRAQYVGLWPEEKKNAMADLLFSSEFDDTGSPKGIGLSLWRFNIGSGSHEAGDASGITSDWRRTECFLDKDGNWDWTKQKGQRWFLEAAKKRGVPYSLGFSITAPYFMTKNGMARASDTTPYANIREDQYRNYASFMAEVCDHLGIDYLSPINEPQWAWNVSRQEGMQATNEESAKLIKLIDEEITVRNSKTKVVFGEAADIRYLYRGGMNALRDNQIAEMFLPTGPHYIGDLKNVAKTVSGHSYWSTWPLDTLISTRAELRAALPEGYTYWQTEFCPMEQNPDNPNGGGQRDFGMDYALYVARIIHHDLTVAEASSWQSWTAFSEGNYKDVLIYIGDETLLNPHKKVEQAIDLKEDGYFLPTKYMWALGNYSFFVRPGMKRIAQVGEANVNNVDTARDLMASAYIDKGSKKVVIVFVNYGTAEKQVKLSIDHLPKGFGSKTFKCYETSNRSDLKYVGETRADAIAIPARSVVTLVNK
ncbi:MAG TPA: hypothetical protein H9859_08360 [Candidatus Barnesiella excrementigallinarum]|nr:hypothetical protein [Candidatus Barnesiella excrementigallinarum]